MTKKNYFLILVFFVVTTVFIGWRLGENKKVIDQNSRVAVANEQFEIIPVKTIIAGNKLIDDQLKISGVFVAKQDLKVLAQAQGQIVEMNVKKGSWVEKGKVLARLDGSSANSQLLAAHAQLDKAQKDAERYANAAEAGGVSKMQAEQYQMQVKSAQAVLASVKQQSGNYTITAPVSGIINDVYVEKGSVLIPGAPMFELVDITSVRLQLKVDQADLVKHVRVNEGVDVTTEVYPEKFFFGKVESVGVKADESQKFDVQVLVKNNKETPLLAGMYGAGSFKGDTSNLQILTIPRSALIGSLKEPRVFVVKNDNTVTEKHVVTGRIIADDVEILNGITPGEQVVIGGQINLSEGKKVSVNR